MGSDRGSYVGYNAGYELDMYNAMYVMMQSMISKVWTAIPVKVVRIYDNYFVDVLPVIKAVDGSGKVLDTTTQYHVPYTRIQGGVNGIIINPHVGDFGLCIYAQNDISVLKNIREQKSDSSSLTDPVQIGSYRSHNLSDGMYIGGMMNAMPTRYLRISDDDIYIEGNGKPVTVHTSNKVTIDATNDISLKTTTKILLDSPVIEVTGVFRQTGSKSSGASSSFSDDLVANGISVSTHVHTGVETGSSNTGTPYR